MHAKVFFCKTLAITLDVFYISAASETKETSILQSTECSVRHGFRIARLFITFLLIFIFTRFHTILVMNCNSPNLGGHRNFVIRDILLRYSHKSCCVA